jgi:hypothetical protein
MAKSVEELQVYQKALMASAEVSAIMQLLVGVHRRHLSEPERAALDAKYEEVAKMLTGLIAHLEAEDRKHRRRARGLATEG